MRLLLSEYICGGSWPEHEFPPTLAAEGAAMLKAVVEDFLKLPDVEVWTTWDHRLGAFPLTIGGQFGDKLCVAEISSPEEERSTKDSLLNLVDAALIIAPETGGMLRDRCLDVESQAGVRSLNATPEAIELCGDKHALHQHLTPRGIRMPRQAAWEDRGELARSQRGKSYVCKLRDGAGSQGMRLIDGIELEFTERLSFPCDVQAPEWIVEEYMPGRAISVAAIFDSRGQLRTIFPIAEQHLSNDGKFVYLGGTIPADDVQVTEIEYLIRQVTSLIPGLRGYIGFDVVLPIDSPDRPCLIEINPRLTTSYVGYRAIAQDNLARWLIPWEIPQSHPVFRGRIRFPAHGLHHQRPADETQPTRQ